MAESFDPYHKWLGIPPKDQPPNHYRLLGLEKFESDADVIDSAANRLMSYLHGLSTGNHTRECQKLLNEISTARLCLLDEVKRAAYEDQLRGEQEKVGQRTRRAVRSAPKPPAPPPAPRQAPPPRPSASVAPAPANANSDAPSYAERRHSAYQAKRQRKPWGIVIGLAAVTLVVVGAGIWVLAGGISPQRPEEPANVAQNGNPAVPTARPDPRPEPKQPTTPPPGADDAGADSTNPPDPGEGPAEGPAQDPPDIPTDPTPPVVPVPEPTPEAELAALLAKAESALIEKRVPAGITLLEEYLADPAAPNRGKAQQLLEHARYAVSDERAMNALRQLDAAQLDGVAQGSLRVNLNDIQFNPPVLLDVFQESLRRNVDKARELLAASSTPTEPVKPEPEPDPAAKFDPATQPAEFLAAKGLAADGAFWLLAAESESAERPRTTGSAGKELQGGRQSQGR